jgi:hypothetical protein
MDLNHRPLGYEPNELPDCSTPHLYGSAVLVNSSILIAHSQKLPLAKTSSSCVCSLRPAVQQFRDYLAVCIPL